ncbi:MAG: hypothetical protein Q9160_007579 [Pyrenula sp. 1 TL-2023]
MLASRQPWVFTFLFALLTTLACSQEPRPAARPRGHVDQDSFQRLLSDVSDDSIHSVLHDWAPKFRDGVFSKDRTAIEAVHSENARLATRLVNLAKRQGSGGNSTSPSPSPSPSPSTSTPPGSSSQGSGSTTAGPTTTPSAVTTSTTLAPASSPSSASPISTDSNGVVFSSINGGKTTVPTSSKPVTYRPQSSTVLSTSTLPDGSQSTLTSVTVVNAPDSGPAAAPTGDVGSGGSGSGSGGPSLQTGSATANKGYGKEVALVLGGAMVVAMAL